MLITATDSTLLGSYSIPQTGDRPSPDILWHTGWTAYPGSQWQEEPPGHWTRAVYRHATPGAGQ